MKFEKESFINFLKGLKNGSDLIVKAIKERGAKQDTDFATLKNTLTGTQKTLTEIKGAIKEKNIDLEPLQTDISEAVKKIDHSLKKIGDAIVISKIDEVKVKNAIEILKPSWLPKFEISLDPITSFFNEIKNLLKKITEKETIVLPVNNGRILVEVDRVGSGGGNPIVTSHLAREETLAPQETIYNGAKSSIGVSALQMTTTSIVTKKGVLIKAANGNTGIVYVGKSGLTAGMVDATDGFELGAGESVTVPVDNANKVYVIASTTAQKVYWMAL